jgi:hypothetical protein
MMNSSSLVFAAERDLLYSPVLDERLDATQKNTVTSELAPAWPWGNRGAANAWMIMVGPSPGKPNPNIVPTSQSRRIGMNHGFSGFDHLAHRNPTWLALAEAGFGSRGSPKLRSALSALFNLCSIDTSDASSLTHEELDRFSDRCIERILECRPRVVIAIERRVFEILASRFSNRQSFRRSVFDAAANSYTGRITDCYVWQYNQDGYVNEIILIRAPSHPSRPDRALRGVSSMSAEGIQRRYDGIRRTVDKFEEEFPARTVFQKTNQDVNQAKDVIP